jgi:ribosomal-protein-alanine N-acetyltransferase
LLKSTPKIETIRVRTTQLVYQFYKKMDFELVKIEKDYWAVGFDLYLMELKISRN